MKPGLEATTEQSLVIRQLHLTVFDKLLDTYLKPAPPSVALTNLFLEYMILFSSLATAACEKPFYCNNFLVHWH